MKHHDRNYNPPAFAAAAGFEMDKTDVFEQHGMTLRDYFAAKNMHALLTHERNLISAAADVVVIDELAKSSYIMADALLKARQS
jgi:hypothetical protein